MEQLIETIKPVLQNVLKLDSVDHVTAETRLFEELNMDSTSALELLMALEDVIEGLVIDPETLEADHFKSVGNLAGYVQSRLAAEAVTV